MSSATTPMTAPPDFFGAGAAMAAAALASGRAGGSVFRCRDDGPVSSVETLALGVSRVVGGTVEFFRGGSELTRWAGGEAAAGGPDDVVRAVAAAFMPPEEVGAAGIPISVPFAAVCGAAAAPTGAGFPVSEKSGLFPISDIEPPASLSASSRSSAACFITVRSFGGGISPSLLVCGNIPAAGATGVSAASGRGGGVEAPIPMIVSLRTSPGRSCPGATDTGRGRSDIISVDDATAASLASFSVA